MTRAGCGHISRGGERREFAALGLKPRVPATLVVAALLLAVDTLVASLMPSMRAANVNPIDSLRAE
ncbi:hypothetical protein DYQ86_04540 [Acidobacteria bacterium AB60]|nr:hypothetical protein DYQ86_04540 [Acidobacteria bacterium AB60]